MAPLSVREYRNNLAASFDKVDKGESVFIRRKGKIYALSSLGSEDNIITPALKEKINNARREYQAGNFISCRSKEELDNFLNSL